eukprot:gnl/MRDRNA2_/MRDRNA2_100804_c0_seq1.p1 gnl/MRDRNA2_/MRDRNA2_100804_c0~~gnl/MRDRNA2_/MRDRNA2_100804_c0_seq1.p1  ORF type:complete len:238 (-),score=76.29 gnl/MRDRNA2_/MRDRNA2_100804_c0_seq1:92-805(-)
MKPAWDKLMGNFATSKISAVVDVNCNAFGESLCREFNIENYPTIKYGDPRERGKRLLDYDGEREYEALKQFADDNLGAICRPKRLELCGSEEKNMIAGFLSKEKEELQEDLKRLEKEYGDQKKAYEKKRRIFDEKTKKLEEDQAVYKEDKESYLKAKKIFEKKGKKATDKEKKKQAEKDKSIQDRYEALQIRKEAHKQEQKDFKAAKKAFQDWEKNSGVKHMKAVVRMKVRNEKLEL